VRGGKCRCLSVTSAAAAAAAVMVGGVFVVAQLRLTACWQSGKGARESASETLLTVDKLTSRQVLKKIITTPPIGERGLL